MYILKRKSTYSMFGTHYLNSKGEMIQDASKAKKFKTKEEARKFSVEKLKGSYRDYYAKKV